MTLTDSLLPLFGLSFSLLLLGLATNFYRSHRRYHIRLKPNCLLTRHPILFLTGPRSIFYFKSYWNAYPEILAEHGYEVFTLHLPWSGQQRAIQFKAFLDKKTIENKKFHFICDQITKNEMQSLIEHHPTIASLTVPQNSSGGTTKIEFQNLPLSFSYRLHSLRFTNQAPRPDDLGVFFPRTASKLLERMHALGEQDLLSY